jgi:riboflavin kinase / FMN adenylyltransferase
VNICADPAAILRPTAIALGNFDGIHRGHQALIQRLLATAGTAHPTVVTFDPHPQDFFSGETRPRLTTPEEKAAILAQLGVAQLVLLPFNRALVEMTPAAFVEQIIHGQLAAQRVIVGADFRFGYQRRGDAAQLQQLTAALGQTTEIFTLHTDGGDRIGSSRVRTALLAGDLEEVQRLLGRAYTIGGWVVKGQQLGQTLGFPTANIAFGAHKFLPRLGVYCVQIELADGDRYPAVANVGKRPTVAGQSITLEVHLLDWQGDLYGQQVTVHLDKFLRSEQKFADLGALTTQIEQDCQVARSFYGLLDG